MEVRSDLDPEIDLPHIYGHGITEEEVEYAREQAGQGMMSIPENLLPAIRELPARQ
jgi:hypothetical protein